MSDDLLCWNHRHCHLWDANNIYVMIRKHWARHGQGLLGIQRQEWGVNQSVWSTGDNRRRVQHNMSQSQAQASHNEDKKLALSYHDHQTISELSSQQKWVLRLGGFWIIEVLLDLKEITKTQTKPFQTSECTRYLKKNFTCPVKSHFQSHFPFA